jgi:hypothetical protein
MATDSKHKKQSDSSPYETAFEDNYGEYRHSKWRDLFRQLCEFKVQFGHCRVSSRYSINPKLGKWVSHQRTRYRKCKSTGENSTSSMIAEHMRALDGIGFDWGTSKTELTSLWNVRFQQMREYKLQFGDCLVPKRYSASPKLGRWVETQRKNYRLYQEGKPGPMTAERIRELESVEFK